MSIFFLSINLLLIAVIAWWFRRRSDPSLRVLFWPALGCKLMAGTALGLIYQYYYHGVGDTFRYFSDAGVIATFARQHPVDYLTYLWDGDRALPLISDVATQPRTLFMLKLASIFNLLTHDNYWVTSAYFSFISFISTWYLVTQIVRHIPAAYWPAVVGFLFLPSAVFWSSGLIKESLAMAGLFLIAGVYVKGWFQQPLRIPEILLIPIALWVVWNLKYYFLGVLLPVGTASFVLHSMNMRRTIASGVLLRALVWLVTLMVPLVLVSWLHPNFQPRQLMAVIVENYETFHALSAPEDLISFNNLEPNWMSLASHVPKALFSGWFRPMIWETSSALQLVVAIENTVLLVLFIASLSGLPQAFRSTNRLLVVTVLLYAAALAAFLALSAPNFGTLSRYRVGFLSAFFTVLACGNPLFYNVMRKVERYAGDLAR